MLTGKRSKGRGAQRRRSDKPRMQLMLEAEAAEEEEDPLDAYMAGLSQPAQAPAASKSRHVAQCDEEEDHVVSYLERTAQPSDSDDDDGAPAAAPRRQLHEQRGKMDLLPPVDHSSRAYAEFNKCFYVAAHAEVRGMSEEEVDAYRNELNVTCTGFDVPRPIKRFEHAGLDASLMAALRRRGYEAPTPIQCAALPVALSGRDLIGIAKTGSGKTAAYLLPLLTHVMDQPELQKGDGPIGVIIAPTHELAEQIVTEGRKFAKGFGVRVMGAYGGVSKHEQFKELRAGCEMPPRCRRDHARARLFVGAIAEMPPRSRARPAVRRSEVVVGTPGRILELMRMKGGMSSTRVTYANNNTRATTGKSAAAGAAA